MKQHIPLFALLLIYLIIASLFSVLIPLDETPDEEAHFALVRFIVETGRYPITNAERLALGDKGDASPIYHGLVAIFSQPRDVSALPQRHTLSPAKQFIPYDTIPTDQKLHTEDEKFPWRGIVLAWHRARLVSIILNLLTIIATYATIRIIAPTQPYLALAVTGFIAFLPYFLINSAIVNDDNLVIPLTTLAIYYLIRIIHGDTRHRATALLGILTGLAVITKYHALVLLPQITLIFIILASQNKTKRIYWLKRWGGVILSFLITTSWWFVAILTQFNQIAELGLISGLLAPLGDPTTTQSTILFTDATQISLNWAWVSPVFRSFWMVTGSLQHFAPDIIYHLLTFITLLACFGLGLRYYLNTRLNPPTKLRPDILLLALHFLLYLGIVIARYHIFLAEGTEPPPYSTQGRHLYPALISIAFFYVLGWQSLPLAWSKWVNQKVAIKSYNRLGAWLINLGLPVFSLLLFFYVFLPIYRPYLPITTRNPTNLDITQRLNVTLADNLQLIGYTLSQPAPSASHLDVRLYWEAITPDTPDHIIQLCLNDPAGRSVTCQSGYPAEGIYPMRAWEAGYLIRDEHHLPLPEACLVSGNYQITLAVWPVDTDAATTTISQNNPQPQVLSLGTIKLRDLPQPPLEATNTFCLAGTCRTQGQITLSQMRQTLTVFDYQPDSSLANQPKTIRLTQHKVAEGERVNWLPLSSNPPYACPNGQTVQSHSFILSPEIQPGLYHLEINQQSQKMLTVQVTTRHRNFQTPPHPQKPTNITFAQQLTLLGYNADLSNHQPTTPLTVTTYWQTQQKMNQTYNLALHLLDNTQTTRRVYDQPLGHLYPSILWAPGEFTTVNHILSPASQPLLPGLYTLELRLYNHSANQFQPLPMIDTQTNTPIQQNPILGQVRIIDPAQAEPPPQNMLIHFGDKINLQGYNVSQTTLKPGDHLSLALYWQALDQPQQNYTVFTQLIGPHGQVWGQQDNQPQGGRYPTIAWQANDKIVDRYQITLPPDAPPGLYHLLIGLYQLNTGQRVTARNQANQQLSNNAVILTQISVQSINP